MDALVNRLEPGKTLKDLYIIDSFLGEGSSSYNYIAHQVQNPAVKVVVKQTKHLQNLDNDESKQDRFFLEREFRILQLIDYPRIARAITTFTADNAFFLVREYRDGATLEEHIARDEYIANKKDNISRQLLETLHYIHSKGITCRDLKSSNILLEPNGSIFLFDFGCARHLNTRKIEDFQYPGTQGFAPPEQYGTDQTDMTTDIYSFAAIYYHMSTRESPADNPGFAEESNFRKHFTHYHFANFFLKCLAPDPGDRFQDAETAFNHMFPGEQMGVPSVLQRIAVPASNAEGAPSETYSFQAVNTGKSSTRNSTGNLLKAIIAILIIILAIYIAGKSGEESTSPEPPPPAAKKAVKKKKTTVVPIFHLSSSVKGPLEPSFRIM